MNDITTAVPPFHKALQKFLRSVVVATNKIMNFLSPRKAYMVRNILEYLSGYREFGNQQSTPFFVKLKLTENFERFLWFWKNLF